jgi:ABC-type multidrug transport system ATPase subunit
MAKRIDVNNVDIFYGSFHAVEDVSMTVEPRTVTSFIGPSGCGKSTLLRPRASIRWPYAAWWAWSSSDRTPSRPCRSSTTWRRGCG